MPRNEKKAVGELIYGINPVVELLKSRRRKLISIYTTKPTPKGWQKIEKLMPKYPVAIQYVTREVITRMAGTADNQGIVAWVQPFGYRKKPFDPQKQPFIVLLDGIQDPRNLGAIIRSAHCAGANGVIICKKGGAPLSATAIKSSAGLAENVEIYQAPSVQAAVQELKASGYNLYLATFDGQNAAECKYAQPTCLVIGSEGLGVSKQLMGSGTHVTLPQRSADISYNASVAAGILLFIVGTQHKRI
jgi:23S rRNA (guanosine2251-2'-O)-methyltransferase